MVAKGKKKDLYAPCLTWLFYRKRNTSAFFKERTIFYVTNNTIVTTGLLA